MANHAIHELPIQVPFITGFTPRDSLGIDNNIHLGGQNGNVGSLTFRNTTNQLIGIGNVWSIAQVWRINSTTGPTTVHTLFNVESSTAGNMENAIRFSILGNEVTDALQILLYDSAGVLFKDYDYDAPISPATTTEPVLTVITWDGTDLKFYKNGMLQTPSTTATDNAGTMTNSLRGISGSQLVKDGTLSGFESHWLQGIWTTVLTAEEVLALWADGMMRAVDWNINANGYVSADTLLHYWKINHDISGSGSTAFKNYSKNGSRLNIGTTNSGWSFGTTGLYPSTTQNSRDITVSALSFDGSSESLRNTTEQSLGIGNKWSIGIWLRANAVGATAAMLDFRSAASTTNQIILQLLGAASDEAFNVIIRDSANATIKNYQWPFFVNPVNAQASQSFKYIVVTWDGTDLKAYRNGKAYAPTTLTTDTTGTMTDTDRAVNLMCVSGGLSRLGGLLHSVAVWDRVLDAPNVETLFNHGLPLIDLSKNRLGYCEADHLKHWWRIAHPAPASGRGSGTGTFSCDFVESGGINVETDAANITTADLTALSNSGTIGHCMRFNVIAGVSNFLANTTPQRLNISTAWTIMCWHLRETAETAGGVSFIGDNGSSIVLSSDATSARLRVQVYDRDGTLFWDKQYNSGWFASAMGPWTVTYNGTTIVVYSPAGAAITASVTTVNSTGVMEDAPREIWMAADRGGTSGLYGVRMSSIAVWNVTFTIQEVRTICGWFRPGWKDLRYAFTDYSQTLASALKHWWMPGFDPSFPGRDYALTATPIDIAVNGGLNTTTQQQQVLDTYGNDG